MGKRVTGHYWVDHMDSGREPIHACNYLLAVDVEMTVLPGYEFASWDQGYGDIALPARPHDAAARPVARERPRS